MIALFLGLVLGCSLAPPPEVAVPPVAEPAPAPTQGAAASATDPVVQAMQGRPLDYTRHARCRMDCREIDEGEVEQILKLGRRDPSRTRHDGACPSHALEGRTDDGQEVRIVYAACPDETRVVTAIDLGAEHDCDCQ